jgi:hypothetical protein
MTEAAIIFAPLWIALAFICVGICRDVATRR